jgi:hypothetical protein
MNEEYGNEFRDGVLYWGQVHPSLFGIDVISSRFVPPPRKITPGEWATRYVAAGLKERDTTGALRNLKVSPAVTWDTEVTTMYLLPRTSPVIPLDAIPEPTEVEDFDQDSLAELRDRDDPPATAVVSPESAVKITL